MKIILAVLIGLGLAASAVLIARRNKRNKLRRDFTAALAEIKATPLTPIIDEYQVIEVALLGGQTKTIHMQKHHGRSIEDYFQNKSVHMFTDGTLAYSSAIARIIPTTQVIRKEAP